MALIIFVYKKIPYVDPTFGLLKLGHKFKEVFCKLVILNIFVYRRS